jgi:beta-D-xylosidase 4
VLHLHTLHGRARVVCAVPEREESETHTSRSAQYVANSVESSTENHMQWNRFEINSEVTQQDLMDSYMPAFQACVEKGRVSGLMCSLNALNGIPACESSAGTQP